MNDEGYTLHLEEIDAGLEKARRFLDAGKASNGHGFKNMFQVAPKQPSPPKDLPTPDQLVELATLVWDKDALFVEFDADRAEYEKNEPPRTTIDDALRRALHLRVRAVRMLEHAESLDATSYACFCHDWKTAIDLDSANEAEREKNAWRFYPEQTDDDLRRHLSESGVKGEFKRHGLPNALKKWWHTHNPKLSKKQVDKWWESKRRAKGAYYAVYEWEVTHFIGWNSEQYRKANREGVAAYREKKKALPRKTRKKPIAAMV